MCIFSWGEGVYLLRSVEVQCWWCRYPKYSWLEGEWDSQWLGKGADLRSQEEEGGGHCVELQVEPPKCSGGDWWRWAYYVWGTLHQTGDDNLVDIPWRQQNHHWATRPKIPQDRKNRVRQSKVLTFQHSPFQPFLGEDGVGWVGEGGLPAHLLRDG